MGRGRGRLSWRKSLALGALLLAGLAESGQASWLRGEAPFRAASPGRDREWRILDSRDAGPVVVPPGGSSGLGTDGVAAHDDVVFFFTPAVKASNLDSGALAASWDATTETAAFEQDVRELIAARFQPLVDSWRDVAVEPTQTFVYAEGVVLRLRARITVGTISGRLTVDGGYDKYLTELLRDDDAFGLGRGFSFHEWDPYYPSSPRFLLRDEPEGGHRVFVAGSGPAQEHDRAAFAVLVALSSLGLLLVVGSAAARCRREGALRRAPSTFGDPSEDEMEDKTLGAIESENPFKVVLAASKARASGPEEASLTVQ